MISTDQGKYVRNEMKTQYFWLTYWLTCSFHFQSEDVVLSYEIICYIVFTLNSGKTLSCTYKES